MTERPEVLLGRLLTAQSWTLSVAETTAGGLICARIVGVPGSSGYFHYGVVAYSKQSKTEILGIDKALLEANGAVSEEAAVALAGSVREMAGTTFGLAETGIAGPIRGRSPKPVGTACIALVSGDMARSESVRFEGDREAIRAQITERALCLATDALVDLSA
jgi:PncC family amidohydrolase